DRDLGGLRHRHLEPSDLRRADSRQSALRLSDRLELVGQQPQTGELIPMKTISSKLPSFAAICLSLVGFPAAARAGDPAPASPTVPSVTCYPLTVCAVELAAGEK